MKISKVSIAEVSGMILGEPGQPVRLKFTRISGRSKRKYKVVLKRTVRATLEPTYRVQKDGINTRVTHIHLDCLQHPGNTAPEQPPDAPQVRDVLDANGNVVGPGLLEHARTLTAPRDSILSPSPCPGVERIDSSHPAWPGNNSRGHPEHFGQGGALPRLKPKPEASAADRPPKAANGNQAAPQDGQSENPQAPPPSASGATQDRPAPDEAPLAPAADLDAASILGMYQLLPQAPPPAFAAPLPVGEGETPPAAAVAGPPAEPVAPSTSADAAAGLLQWAPPAADASPPAEMTQGVKFTAVAVPASEVEEEEQGGVHDWEGLAESRIAVFEAKQRASKPARAAAPKQATAPRPAARHGAVTIRAPRPARGPTGAAGAHLLAQRARPACAWAPRFGAPGHLPVAAAPPPRR